MNTSSPRHEFLEGVQSLIQAIMHFLTLTVFRVFFRLEISGQKEAWHEVIKARKDHKGIIFASNHLSELDAVLVRCCLPIEAIIFPMYYVGMTKEHYDQDKYGWRKYLYGGLAFKAMGAYPAYKGMHDYQASLINHIELLEQGKTVCIFPEGKISVETRKPTPARGGTTYMSVHTKTDIIPVRISGANEVGWKSIFTFTRPLVKVEYNKIISYQSLPEGVTDDENKYKLMSEKIMTAVRG